MGMLIAAQNVLADGIVHQHCFIAFQDWPLVVFNAVFNVFYSTLQNNYDHANKSTNKSADKSIL